MKFEIQTQFIYGWENCWKCDDKPEYFESYEQARNALDDFLEEMAQERIDGNIEDEYSIEDYRIIGVQE